LILAGFRPRGRATDVDTELSTDRDEHMDPIRTLNEQRAHILGAVEGLSDADMRRARLPSGWSPLSLINHLTLDVELFWFQAVILGREAAIAELDTIDNAWHIEADVPVRRILDRYQQQIDLANEVCAAVSMDDEPAWWPEGVFGSWRLKTNGDIVMHVITETAVHAGHLDAARELIDRKQWIVLT
jgi:hypothetical protein